VIGRRRILFVAADVPWPPDGGGRIASLHVLEAFCRSHDVDLVALADPLRRVSFDHLETICRKVAIVSHPFSFSKHPIRQVAIAVRSLFSTEPYRLLKFRSARLSRTIADWKGSTDYDLVHHEQFGVAQVRDANLPSTALVQNVESEIYRRARGSGTPIQRAWAAIEGGKLAMREPALLARFDEVFVLTDQDRTQLVQRGVERVALVPMPAPDPAPARSAPARPAILSMGSMSWFGVAEGLAWFHDRVLPLVRTRVPDVTWDLVGPGAPGVIRSYAREPGIALQGYVPDVGPFVEGARVAIVPLNVAGGIRMKLLELMAQGLPAVATTIGAEGIGFRDGDGCFRRDTPEAFADQLVRLLTDDALWLETAERGRAFLAGAHTADELRAAIDAGVERAIRRHGEAPRA